VSSIPASMTSVVRRPKDPRVRALVIETLRAANPPMVSIPLIRQAIKQRTGTYYVTVGDQRVATLTSHRGERTQTRIWVEEAGTPVSITRVTAQDPNLHSSKQAGPAGARAALRRSGRHLFALLLW